MLLLHALPKPVTVLSLGMPTQGASEGASWAGLVQQADVLVGGKRYLALFPDFHGDKIAIGSHVDQVVEGISAFVEKGKRVVVLASGDSMFFGIGNRMQKEFGPDVCACLPGVSSLQAAAAILGISAHDLCGLSLHGRMSWLSLAHALLDEKNIFLLTDKNSTPDKVAAYLQERGYSHYGICLLENIFFSPEKGFQADVMAGLSLPEALAWTSDENESTVLRVLLLFPLQYIEKTPGVHRLLAGKYRTPAELRPLAEDIDEAPLFFGGGAYLGIPDAFFEQENKLITKKQIRAMGLSALKLLPEHTLWDIGAGSGAVGIEASRLVRRGRVCAVEQHPHRVEMITQNRARFQAANLDIYTGAALEVIPALPAPDRVFVGGGLGGSEEKAYALLSAIWERLRPGGRIVAHCVLLQSLERARHILRKLGAEVHVSLLQHSRSVPLGSDIYLQPENPVYLVLAEKEQL